MPSMQVYTQSGLGCVSLVVRVLIVPAEVNFNLPQARTIGILAQTKHTLDTGPHMPDRVTV